MGRVRHRRIGRACGSDWVPAARVEPLYGRYILESAATFSFDRIEPQPRDGDAVGRWKTLCLRFVRLNGGDGLARRVHHRPPSHFFHRFVVVDRQVRGRVRVSEYSLWNRACSKYAGFTGVGLGPGRQELVQQLGAGGWSYRNLLSCW